MKRRLPFNLFLFYLLPLFLSIYGINIYSQNGFVRASGKQILDPEGKNLILRGIGTGNWLLQEGYMMQTTDVALTQSKFRERLIGTVGEEKTNTFYQAWWDNHFQKVDVDSMAAWGFNSIRVALHYKMFTLPIEQEPVEGENTWIEEGFTRMDNLLQWCADNKIYLILDMHGAPGGQGTDQAISDYDPTKPSLWENDLNKQKLIALWKKLAERYSSSKWIGAYDLINEPVWSLPNSNKALWDLFKDITTAIREVDKNHMIILAGNSWGNDYSGLPALWDNNLCLSFHKYWTHNQSNALDWMISLRDQRNVPIWLGESGENSNTWFTDLIALCEKNNIGWSWWPVKKSGINNILRVDTNADYLKLLETWRGNGSMTTDAAFSAVMKFAENHKFENNHIQYDVIDAMIRRPHTDETRAYKKRTASDIINASDYDYGRIGYAYFDVDDANYHGDGGGYTTWNQGWAYRNDGVDIEATVDGDQGSNGFCVSWIEDGEWLQYEVDVPKTMGYAVQIRYASQSGGAKVYLEADGKRISGTYSLASTGSWTAWKYLTIPNVILPAGVNKVRVVFEKGGANFGFFKFVAPKEIDTIQFESLYSETDKIKDIVYLTLNKKITSFDKNAFEVKLNNASVNIESAEISTEDPRILIFKLNSTISATDLIKISYKGQSCLSETQVLSEISEYEVTNRMNKYNQPPVTIEAEDYLNNNGFAFEACEDVGGGQNSSYAANGHYLEYFLYTDVAGEYNLDFRVAVNVAATNILLFDVTNEEKPLKAFSLKRTGGWQIWNTQSTTINLNEGKNIIRIQATEEGFNLNWLKLSLNSASLSETESTNKVTVHPNPVYDILTVQTNSNTNKEISIYDVSGKKLVEEYSLYETTLIDTTSLSPGIYLLNVEDENTLVSTQKFIKK